MANKIINVGHIEDGNDVMIRAISKHPPFSKASCQIFEVYKVGTDFASGDNLKFQFKSIKKVFAVATNDVGAVLSYTEAPLSGEWTGIELTFSSVTTDLKLFAITDV